MPINYRHIPKTFVLVLVVNLVIFSILEIGSRIYFKIRPWAPPAVSFHHSEFDNPYGFIKDNELFWRLKPNNLILNRQYTGSRHVKAGIRVNALGLRGKDIVPDPPHCSIRIVCMGDSNTFGWQVGDMETYPAQLEKHIQTEQWTPLPVEVINAGVPGYSSFQGKRLLEKVVLPLKPDIVLIGYGANDQANALGANDEIHAINMLSTPPALKNPSWLTRSHLIRVLSMAIHKVKYHESIGQPRVSETMYRQNIIEMIERCREHGALPLLVSTYYHDVAEDIDQKYNVPHEELRPSEIQKNPSYIIGPEDLHCTALGYAVVIEWLASKQFIRNAVTVKTAEKKCPEGK